MSQEDTQQRNLQSNAEGNAQGSAQGNADGNAQDNAQGNAEGNAQGSAQGNADGNAEGSAEGNAQGNVQGSAEGNAQANAQGNADGSVEGSAAGNAESSIVIPPPQTMVSAAGSEGGSPREEDAVDSVSGRSGSGPWTTTKMYNVYNLQKSQALRFTDVSLLTFLCTNVATLVSNRESLEPGLFVTLLSLYGLTIGLSVTASVLLLIVNEKETILGDGDVEEVVCEAMEGQGSAATRDLELHDHAATRLLHDSVDTRELHECDAKLCKRCRLKYNRRTHKLRLASTITLLLQLFLSIVTAALSGSLQSKGSSSSVDEAVQRAVTTLVAGT